MGDFDTLYAGLDPDSQVRGTQFEYVCKWFFENDPVYSRELRRVWLWSDWPGRWGGDAGIDLVSEDRNGCLWAIQAKAYDPKYRVSKKDVDKFLAESGRKVFSYRMLIATTDLIDRTGERTIQQQEKRSSFLRLNDLRAAAVDWPATPADLRPAKTRKLATPRPHQAAAIRDVVTGFQTSDRGQLVMACGTGKTLTGLFITEKLAAKRTLVLLPSLSLLKQTLNEWRANATADFASLPVCSDETVNATDDAAIAHTADLGVPVTTDAKEIAAFLRRRSGPLMVFSTYQSSPQIANAFALGRVPGFDLIIADEAHRCAGPVSSDFAAVLDPIAIKGARRLFMTATPRYFTGRVLKAAQDADYEVASMDDEQKFGPVFHRLSFGDAIERDLLTDYQVAIVGVDDVTYRQWAEAGALVTRDGKQICSAATLAGQIGLATAMRKYDLRRIISFHSRVARARDFANSLPDVIDWMPAGQRPSGALWAHVASGEMPAGDRYVLLQRLSRLEDGERGLLANTRCLSEGVDVPTLDGVAFIDPRRSEVDIVQGVGRAIRKSEAKTVGTIVIPVFIDTDADPEVALDSSLFKPVWDVIKALRAHDAELGEQLDALRREMGRTGGNPKLPDKIHVDVPAAVGADFARAFDARLVQQTAQPWEFWFGLLENYVAEHGTSQVPSVYRTREGYRLGWWVTWQRQLSGEGKLDAVRVRRLSGLRGWSWDVRADQWEYGFTKLTEYIVQNGTAKVVRTGIFEGFKLGLWVGLQRRALFNGSLAEERRARLEALPGWTWDPFADQWEEGFQKVLDFTAEAGDSRVPRTFTVDGFRLGGWVKKQRAAFSQGLIDIERQRRLEALPGWTWDPFADMWEDGFDCLSGYFAQHGAGPVPKNCVFNGFSLGSWVHGQRRKYAQGTLDADRQRRLEALPGWTWEAPVSKWEQGFRHLLTYVDEHGDARVPRRMVTAEGFRLGAWINQQRNTFKAGQMLPDRESRLRRLPMWTFNANLEDWEVGYHTLRRYVRETGTADVPTECVFDGHKLGTWVLSQRNAYRQGRLQENRERLLTQLPGWTWNSKVSQWESFYEILLKSAREDGTSRFPRSLVVNGHKLGEWVTVQRARFKQGNLRADRVHRLEAVPGWSWDPFADQWETAFRFLTEYVERHGDARVPYLYVIDEIALGQWVAKQRAVFKKGRMDASRRARLESLPGWSWGA